MLLIMLSLILRLIKIVEPYFNLAEKMGKFISQLIQGGVKEIKIS